MFIPCLPRESQKGSASKDDAGFCTRKRDVELRNNRILTGPITDNDPAQGTYPFARSATPRLSNVATTWALLRFSQPSTSVLLAV